MSGHAKTNPDRGGLHGAISKLGPQVQAFQEAFECLKGQLALLEHEAQIADPPEARQAKPKAAKGEVKKAFDTLESRQTAAKGSELSRGQTCSSLGSSTEVVTSNIVVDIIEDGAGNGPQIKGTPMDVKIPNALASLWPSQAAPGQQARLSCGEPGSVSIRPSYTPAFVLAAGEQPDLDGLWRDLYISNEAEAEEHLEMMLQRRRNSCRVSTAMMSRKSSLATVVSDHIGPGSSHIDTFHPYSNGSLIWLLSSMVLVLYDAVMIPLNVAWDRDTLAASGEYALFLVALCFWTCDIFASMNTGFFDNGVLVMTRCQIIMKYCRTWFLFDACVVLLDYSFLIIKVSNVDWVGGKQILRLLRLGRGVRLGRIVKVKHAADKFEELAIVGSVNKVIVGVAVVNIFFMIFMLAHILTCIWFFMGQYAYENGNDSWLDQNDFHKASIGVQYMRSLHWVLALMTTNTNDKLIGPENELERSFTLVVIMLSIGILGLGASKLGSTIGELNRVNAEADSTKSQLQRYLNKHGVSVDLSTRIIRFALHTLQRRSNLSLDPALLSLLSKKMQAELIVSERNAYIMIHPLFKLISEVHPETLLEVFSAFEARLYSDGERIFGPRTWSEFLCVTANGTYSLARISPDIEFDYMVTRRSSSEDGVQTFDKPQWFSEISLFARVMHHSCLTATSFGDALSLTGTDFAHSVRRFPSCVATIYRYATAYLSRTVSGGKPLPGKILVDDLMPQQLAIDAANVAREGLSRLDLHTVQPPRQNVSEQVKEFICKLSAGSLSDDEVRQQITTFLPELDPECGTYTSVGQEDERKKSLCAVLCVYWLRTNRYDSFTQMQPEPSRMSPELWQEWQRFVRWVDPDDEIFHAMLVFVSLHGLGKVQSLSKMVPREQRNPENVVLHLIDNAPLLVPSMSHLSEDMQDLVTKALGIHSQFNFGQLLQGENTPFHIANLQQCIQEEGESLLKFYLFNLVGMMCAIRGVETSYGSLFMDQGNGSTTLVGVHCLQRLTSAAPQAIYWTYMNSRAVKLRLLTDEPEQFALARLACLTRASTSDRTELQAAWGKLSLADRNILTHHFLADGITQKAYLLAFLPLYFANAKKNQVISLHLALAVLIEIFELLRTDGCAERTEGTTISVSLADIAAFARDVKTPRLFEVAAGFSRVEYGGSIVRITISTKHWQRVNQKTWYEEPLEEVSHIVKKIERKSDAVLETVKSFFPKEVPKEDQLVAHEASI